MGVGGGGLAGFTEIKANSASQQSWSWGLAELGNMMIKKKSELMISNSIEAFAIIKYHVIIIILKCFYSPMG